jgi:glutathione S-transferase
MDGNGATGLRLYSGPLSMFGAKAEIAAREKGLDFELVMVPFDMQRLYEPKHPEILRINPKRQVPVLVHGDIEIFDSTQIFEYLEEIAPAPRLWPAGVAARTRARLLELKSDEVYFPHIIRLMGLQTSRDDLAAVAAAAGWGVAEMGAGRGNARRPRRHDAAHAADEAPLLVAREPHFEAVAGHAERHDHALALERREAIPARAECLDHELDVGVGCHRHNLRRHPERSEGSGASEDCVRGCASARPPLLASRDPSLRSGWRGRRVGRRIVTLSAPR